LLLLDNSPFLPQIQRLLVHARGEPFEHLVVALVIVSATGGNDPAYLAPLPS
jgi:hypothetical protein